MKPRHAALAAAFVCGAVLSVPAVAGPSDPLFGRLSDEFLDRWLARRPHVATRLGIHGTDDLLVPVTEASLDEEAEWLRGFRTRLQAVRRDGLSFDRALDYDVLAAHVEKELLQLEVIRTYETNPNAYVDLAAGSIQSLLERNFAPLCLRLRAVSRRLAHVPEVLRAARINLQNPSPVFTEAAIMQFEGVLLLYRETLPAAAAGCKDPALQADLAEADSAAVRAVEQFLAFLREDLRVRSDGRFEWGRDTYQKMLGWAEMETTHVDSLLARGWRALEDTQSRMETLAESIAPGAGVAAALDSLARDRPAEDDLVPFVAATLDTVRAFLRTRDLVTLPHAENVIVRETPPHHRGVSLASLDPVGVWERRATEAYFNVTPPGDDWTEGQRRDHLAFFNRYSASILSIHEALPGHYLQFLALRRAPSRLRQVLTARSNTEGWAHYCEQMAVEEGFGSGDPRYELAQLSMAIRRIGRLIVGISLHTERMTQEEALELFRERCYLAPVNAEREARRGALDPMYLVYTLGKWRILELREEARRLLEDRFDLRQFHDAFLRQGASPLPVVRAGVLKELGAMAQAGDRP